MKAAPNIHPTLITSNCEILMALDSITNLEHFIAHVKNNKEILGCDFCTEVNKAADKFINELTESVAHSIMHKLHEKKPTKRSLQAIIAALPSILSVKNDKGLIPLQQAYYNIDSVVYTGLLAKEGVKTNVGGIGKQGRGGLYLRDPTHQYNGNALQCLVSYTVRSSPSKYDLAVCDVLTDLRGSSLLSIEDIKDHNLLWFCSKSGPNRFKFLSDWFPGGLKTILRDRLLFHSIVKSENEKVVVMPMFLKAAIKHFPNEMGLLFQRDNQGITVLERSITKHGREDTFKIIRECIPQDTKLPILHHVVKHAPQYLQYFMQLYPHAVYLRDEEGDGRTYFQARLASGNVTFNSDVQFLTGMSPDQIEMVDPVTDFYPFMVAASEEVCDLDTVYYLVRREPKLVYGNSD